ncbi:Transcriptional coactivator [Cichlidogyrus casuarinus]|uniref:Transcriptional coactivator n=1 Tax=Cichlidogyrus casuarinus TaxID=1844966 RepID=A0ABD2QKS7_9PLAT
MPKHKTSDEDSLSSLSEDDAPKKSLKKQKTSENDSKSAKKISKNNSDIFDAEGRIDLTGNKYISVRNFKGRQFIDIREYYMDKSDGQLKPGKKGVALNVDQWRVLKSVISDIDEKTEVI